MHRSYDLGVDSSLSTGLAQGRDGERELVNVFLCVCVCVCVCVCEREFVLICI